MQSKKLIFNSDDFGLSSAANVGIQKGFLAGVLTSTCIIPNGIAFDEAMEMLPELEGIGFGVHLNIIEGKSLTNQPLLCALDGSFNNGFVSMLLKSLNKKFLSQVEVEFRAQIEKVISKTRVDHINSHVHTHAIPAIFDLTCKLAKEYGIKYIRTHHEIPYIVPKAKKNMTLKYPLNLIKNVLLNAFNLFNAKNVKRYSLSTNDFLIGVMYTGFMDEDAVLYGLNTIKNDDCIAEILIHPAYYADYDIEKPYNYQEYCLTQSTSIKDKIAQNGWVSVNYKNIRS